MTEQTTTEPILYSNAWYRPLFNEWQKSVSGWIVLCSAVFILLFISYQLSQIGSPDQVSFLSDLVTALLSIAVVALAWRVSKHPAIEKKSRRAWRIATLAFSFICFGHTVWFYYSSVLEIQPFPSAADGGFWSFYPVMLIALLSFPTQQSTRNEKIKSVIDATIVLLGAAVAIWYFIINPQIAVMNGNNALMTFLNLSYVVGDLALFLGIAAVFFRRSTYINQVALIALVLGLLSTTAADIGFAWLTMKGTYTSGHWIDNFFVVGLMFFLIASHYQYQFLSQNEAVERVEPHRIRRRRFNWLPLLSIVFIFSLLFTETSPFWASTLGIVIFTSIAAMLLMTIRQIIALRENIRLTAERESKKNKLRFRSLVENSSDMITIRDNLGKVIFQSPSVKKILGYEPDEMSEFSSSDIVHPDDVEMLDNLMEKLRCNEIDGFKYEYRVRHKDGGWRTMEGIAKIFEDSESDWNGVIINSRDITESRNDKEKLQFEASHDSLTQLPNRAQFSKFLQSAIDESRKNRDQKFGVLFFDLDRFKIINDGLGHIVGDKLLVMIAERLKHCVRPNDMVARFGGDEFTILINKIAKTETVIEIADRLLHEFAQPFYVDGVEIFTSASIGITYSDNEKLSPDEFLRESDTAMYRAKAKGKARYEVYDPTMFVNNMRTLKIENDLRRAGERGEFFVLYQPIINLKTDLICEFEALVRWRHPVHGVIPPCDFIPVAEETGQIVAIDLFVLREACSQINRWKRERNCDGKIAVSVNLSTKQLSNHNLTTEIAAIIEELSIDPDCLKLEVTETSVMENGETAAEILTALNDLGINISSDDFGTGYSSMSYLLAFPFQRLKIDQSFVSTMDTNPKSEEIVRTIITLAENLNLEVVAEGVENEEQYNRLRELGCTFAQGYLFSKPVAPEEAGMLVGNFNFSLATR